jgi:hypothetical protein
MFNDKQTFRSARVFLAAGVIALAASAAQAQAGLTDLEVAHSPTTVPFTRK